MTKARKNLQRRLRKMRKRLREAKISPDTLLGLTPICEAEASAFIAEPLKRKLQEEVTRAFREALDRLREKGIYINQKVNYPP